MLILQVRSLEVCSNSVEEIRKFEYSCLGEVRILGALQHACIVEMYGHQISSQRVTPADANPERRIWRSAIYMEYVKGGSLKVLFFPYCYQFAYRISFRCLLYTPFINFMSIMTELPGEAV